MEIIEDNNYNDNTTFYGGCNVVGVTTMAPNSVQKCFIRLLSPKLSNKVA